MGGMGCMKRVLLLHLLQTPPPFCSFPSRGPLPERSRSFSMSGHFPDDASLTQSSICIHGGGFTGLLNTLCVGGGGSTPILGGPTPISGGPPGGRPHPRGIKPTQHRTAQDRILSAPKEKFVMEIDGLERVGGFGPPGWGSDHLC